MESPLFEAARKYREARRAADAASNQRSLISFTAPAEMRNAVRAVALRAEAELRIAEDALLLMALRGE